jgi:RINT-1 / TIP-1 family
MSEDLKEEYSKYIDPDQPINAQSTQLNTTINQLHRENKKRGNFTI